MLYIFWRRLLSFNVHLFTFIFTTFLSKGIFTLSPFPFFLFHAITQLSRRKRFCWLAGKNKETMRRSVFRGENLLALLPFFVVTAIFAGWGFRVILLKTVFFVLIFMWVLFFTKKVLVWRTITISHHQPATLPGSLMIITVIRCESKIGTSRGSSSKYPHQQ